MSFETPLSDQTCAKLITKILQQNLLPGLLTTLDGKEYVTPARLDSEIEDAVLSKGGTRGDSVQIPLPIVWGPMSQ